MQLLLILFKGESFEKDKEAKKINPSRYGIVLYGVIKTGKNKARMKLTGAKNKINNSN